MFEAVLSGIVLGALSIPHCAVMCGPLALFACSRTQARWPAVRYQLGRSASYTVLGALSGHLGQWLGLVTSSAYGPLMFAALTAGVGGSMALRLWRANARPAQPLVQLRSAPPSRSWSRRMLALVPRDALAFAALTALLPCGALAGALLVALASADPGAGALTMLGFATSSGVAVLGAGVVSQLLSRPNSLAWRRALAVALLVAASVTVSRPLLALTNAPASAPHTHTCH